MPGHLAGRTRAELLGREVRSVSAGRHAAPDGPPQDGAAQDGAPQDDRTGPLPGGGQPVPPPAGLPPRPSGPWSKLARRSAAPGDADDAPTVAAQALGPHAGDHGAVDAHSGHHDDHPHEHHHDDHHHDDEDATGGLEVLGAGGSDVGRRRGRRARRQAAAEPATVEAPGLFADEHHDHHDDDHHDDDHHDDDHHDHHDHHDDHGPRRTRGGRRRRSPLANVLALLVLAGVIAGIVFGGRALIGLVNPEAQDYAGAGSGTVEVRVGEGDTLSDIAGTLVDSGVIASSEPFVDAAESEPAATGIQPGVYVLRAQMSGQAALDLLLDPATRQVSRVTVPEGFTLEATLQRIAETTRLPIEDLQAAAADPAALGLPAYAEGQLEGYLFPATYDVEPGDTAADVLGAMVSRFTDTASGMQLEQRAAAAGRSVHDVVVVASMVQAETGVDDERADVAQVIYNRLTEGIPLGIDAALAYGLDKNGNDLTVSDLQSDHPYNLRTRAGLPPTAISAPGEASLEAALAPTTGDLLYYVLESRDGTHFFTASYDEFVAAKQRCAAAGLGCGG
ncbi:endolytic transglycosylase MltG [Geodermatophilus amargosae]|uniref:endolytic transglycosylase MltG n=1 Tax=Geodermatophilus amargosae TaxID=1296565 RepID=UPI0034DEEBFB